MPDTHFQRTTAAEATSMAKWMAKELNGKTSFLIWFFILPLEALGLAEANIICCCCCCRRRRRNYSICSLRGKLTPNRSTMSPDDDRAEKGERFKLASPRQTLWLIQTVWFGLVIKMERRGIGIENSSLTTLQRFSAAIVHVFSSCFDTSTTPKHNTRTQARYNEMVDEKANLFSSLARSFTGLLAG